MNAFFYIQQFSFYRSVVKAHIAHINLAQYINELKFYLWWNGISSQGDNAQYDYWNLEKKTRLREVGQIFSEDLEQWCQRVTSGRFETIFVWGGANDK